MAQLPNVGDEAWGDTLNEFLLVTHNPDGTQRQSTINSSALTAKSISLGDLNTANPPSEVISNLFLSNDGTSLVWKKGLQINVQDFGAKGDGVTDDTNAIQAALDAAVDGGNIVFPRGTYMVRTLIVHYSGTQLTGSRWGTRIKRISGALPLIDISGPATFTGHV